MVCNGERLTADVVIGADGVRSTARKLILGYDDKPKSSGYAIYRAWFDAEECGINDDPLTAMLTEGQRDHFYGWIGQDGELGLVLIEPSSVQLILRQFTSSRALSREVGTSRLFSRTATMPTSRRAGNFLVRCLTFSRVSKVGIRAAPPFCQKLHLSLIGKCASFDNLL